MISQAKKNEIITKHAKKFAAKSGGGRPILEGVHYEKSGSVIACNSCRLLRVKNIHTYPAAFTSDVKTGAVIDGTYPETEKLFPSNFKTEIILSNLGVVNEIKRTLEHIKIAFNIASLHDKETHLMQITCADNGIASLGVTSVAEGISFSALIGQAAGELPFKITSNAEYLLDAFNVFKDSGSEAVAVKFSGNLSPIVISDDENGIDVLILPFRTVS